MHTKSYVQFILQLLALSGKIVCMHAIPRSENGQNFTSKLKMPFKDCFKYPGFLEVELLKIKRKKL